MPREIVANSGESARKICSWGALKTVTWTVLGNIPRNDVTLLPPPSLLLAGQAAGPLVARSQSLAEQAGGSDVSYRVPGGATPTIRRT